MVRFTVIAAVVLALSTIGSVSGTRAEKVTICHAVGQADTTHYVTLNLPRQAVFGEAGHFFENGTTRAGHEQDYLGPCNTPTAIPVASSTVTLPLSATLTPTALCQEDGPCWDCKTMGNLTCGPVSFPDTGGEPPR